MIRLTEMDREDDRLAIKIEGHLTASTLQVVDQTLATYKEQHITAVVFDADGLVSVDRRALVEARARFPTGLHITFCTSRIALQQLLASCDLDVAAPPPD